MLPPFGGERRVFKNSCTTLSWDDLGPTDAAFDAAFDGVVCFAEPFAELFFAEFFAGLPKVFTASVELGFTTYSWGFLMYSLGFPTQCRLRFSKVGGVLFISFFSNNRAINDFGDAFASDAELGFAAEYGDWATQF